MSSQSIIRQYRAYIVPISLIPVAIVIFIFGLFPAGSRILEMTGEYRTLTEDIKLLKNKRAYVESIDEESLLSQLRLAASYIPPDKSIPTVMSTIEGLASESRAEILDVNLQGTGSIATTSAATNKKEKVFGATSLPFVTTISGSPEVLSAFLREIPRARRFLRPLYFTVSYLSQPPQMTIAMEALYEPLPKSSTTVEGQTMQFTQDEESLLAKIAALPDYTRAISEISSTQVPFGMKSNPFAQ